MVFGNEGKLKLFQELEHDGLCLYVISFNLKCRCQWDRKRMISVQPVCKSLRLGCDNEEIETEMEWRSHTGQNPFYLFFKQEEKNRILIKPTIANRLK